MKKQLKGSICAVIMLVLLGAGFVGCSSPEYVKNPVDVLITEMIDKQDFSIILYDMDYEGNSFSKDIYRHKYKIIVPSEDGEVDIKETEWMVAPKKVFDSHVNDMGMEIVSKKDGTLVKKTLPAGYSNYVGNSRYGRWHGSGNSSYWEFYGKYAMMSSLFNLASPVSRGYYRDYDLHVRSGNRSYYGPLGSDRYGTKSTLTNRGGSSKWGKSQSSFKTSSQKSVSRSKSTKTKTSRSSSSSFRSRGGGSGK